MFLSVVYVVCCKRVYKVDNKNNRQSNKHVNSKVNVFTFATWQLWQIQTIQPSGEFLVYHLNWKFLVENQQSEVRLKIRMLPAYMLIAYRILCVAYLKAFYRY